MNADGSNPRRLTDHPETDYAPRWSIDGRIIFTGNGKVSETYTSWTTRAETSQG